MPAEFGAVYVMVFPAPVMKPWSAAQVTEVVEALATVAVRLTVPPVKRLALGGLTLTVIGGAA
jgi:hypothetical protein